MALLTAGLLAGGLASSAVGSALSRSGASARQRAFQRAIDTRTREVSNLNRLTEADYDQIAQMADGLGVERDVLLGELLSSVEDLPGQFEAERQSQMAAQQAETAGILGQYGAPEMGGPQGLQDTFGEAYQQRSQEFTDPQLELAAVQGAQNQQRGLLGQAQGGFTRDQMGLQAQMDTARGLLGQRVAERNITNAESIRRYQDAVNAAGSVGQNRMLTGGLLGSVGSSLAGGALQEFGGFAPLAKLFEGGGAKDDTRPKGL